MVWYGMVWYGMVWAPSNLCHLTVDCGKTGRPQAGILSIYLMEYPRVNARTMVLGLLNLQKCDLIIT